jgi:hypothetical protein
MNAKQRVSAPRRSQLAVSTACCGRGARFAIAQDARRGDHGYQRPGIRGISDRPADWLIFEQNRERRQHDLERGPIRCDRRRREDYALRTEKQQVPALQAKRPDDWATNASVVIEFRCGDASMRRKITPDRPGIRGMSD